jgi:PPOX class probable F420-dependent enzyme
VTTDTRALIKMSPVEIETFLAGSHTLNLATIDPDGLPQVTAVWYALQEGDVVFWAYSTSRKIRNLRRDPSVGGVVETGATYAELQGVSIAGTAELIEEPGKVAAVGRLLIARYAPGSPADVIVAAEASAAKRTAVRIRPRRITSWDHRKLAGRY